MKNNKGITLMSLAIMIVILLILAFMGLNYNENTIEFAKLTKFTLEFEIIKSQLSVLNQSRDYQAEGYVNYGLNETTDVELINKIDAFLEDKLVNIYNISNTDLEVYKKRFQYCSKENANEILGIDGIEGIFLINIQNQMVINYEGLQIENKKYYTLEELVEEGLATNTYKVQYYKHENPYIPRGFYYVGGTWNTGYVISDSQDDKYAKNQERELNLDIVQSCSGNLYMWVPIIEKNENYTNGISWTAVEDEMDYGNIGYALDAYQAGYTIPDYSDKWYSDATFDPYAYINIENEFLDYSGEGIATDEEKNSIFSSIYLNGGIYVGISLSDDV